MAFKWAALSGLAEPLTAAALAPFAANLTASSLDALLAGVAGAMVALSVGELLPLAVRCLSRLLHHRRRADRREQAERKLRQSIHDPSDQQYAED